MVRFYFHAPMLYALAVTACLGTILAFGVAVSDVPWPARGRRAGLQAACPDHPRDAALVAPYVDDAAAWQDGWRRPSGGAPDHP